MKLLKTMSHSCFWLRKCHIITTFISTNKRCKNDKQLLKKNTPVIFDIQ